MLSACAALVQSRESTFFDIAAARAAATNEHVRAVWICPRVPASTYDGSRRWRQPSTHRQTAKQTKVFPGHLPHCFVHHACNFTHANATVAPARVPLRENHEVVSFGEHAQQSCEPPARLPQRLLDRLHFFALTSCTNPHLLGAFHAFYAARGIDFSKRARVVLNGCSAGHLTAARAALPGYGDVVLEPRKYSSVLKNELANSFLQSLPENGLMMYADSDEFFDMEGAELLRRVDAHSGFVLGHMTDRIARDWTLGPYDGSQAIWRAYPRRCPVTARLLSGANTKWIIVPKAIDGVQVRWLNSHYLNVEPLIERRHPDLPVSLPFSHYRFAERARRFGRSDRLAKHLRDSIDTSGAVPRLAAAAVRRFEGEDGWRCGAACPLLEDATTTRR